MVKFIVIWNSDSDSWKLKHIRFCTVSFICVHYIKASENKNAILVFAFKTPFHGRKSNFVPRSKKVHFFNFFYLLGPRNKIVFSWDTLGYMF